MLEKTIDVFKQIGGIETNGTKPGPGTSSTNNFDNIQEPDIKFRAVQRYQQNQRTIRFF